MIPQHIHDSDRLASISSKVYKGILKHKMNKNENENVMFILRYEIKGYFSGFSFIKESNAIYYIM